MKFCSIFLLAPFLGVTLAANSKINQYASLDDCNHDRNIISHASPSEGSCHTIDGRTRALFLVVGSGAAAATFWGTNTSDCQPGMYNTNRCQATKVLAAMERC